MDQPYQRDSFVVMGIGRKVDPGDQSGKCSGQNPREIERCIVRIEQILSIVIVAARFAIAAILRTFVLVFIPTGFVHDMLAFDNDGVSLFKGSFAEVAGLSNQNAVKGHILVGVAGHIFPLEDNVPDRRKDKLEKQIDLKEIIIKW